MTEKPVDHEYRTGMFLESEQKNESNDLPRRGRPGCRVAAASGGAFREARGLCSGEVHPGPQEHWIYLIFIYILTIHSIQTEARKGLYNTAIISYSRIFRITRSADTDKGNIIIDVISNAYATPFNPILTER